MVTVLSGAGVLCVPCPRQLQSLQRCRVRSPTLRQGWAGGKWGAGPSLDLQRGASWPKRPALQWKSNWLKINELREKTIQGRECSSHRKWTFGTAFGFLKDVKRTPGWWLQIRGLESITFRSCSFSLWRCDFWSNLQKSRLVMCTLP